VKIFNNLNKGLQATYKDQQSTKMKFTASESNFIDILDSGSEDSQDLSTGIEVTLGKIVRKFFNEIFLMEPGRNCG